MRRLTIILMLAWGLIQSPITTLHAQSIEMLVPKTGETKCFGRTYDRAHLSQHPDQLVTSIMLRLKTFQKAEEGEGFPFMIAVTVRGDDRMHLTGDVCNRSSDARSVRCIVVCDMGAFTITPATRRGSLRVELDRLAFASDCGGDEQALFELNPGKDDKVFRLDPLLPEKCDALFGNGYWR